LAGSIEQADIGAPRGESFAFRPFARADLPLIFRWLSNPAVVEWWNGPPASIDELEGKYVPRIDGSEAVYGYIAHYAGEPMGFLQWYRLATEPEHPAVGLVLPDAAAIDLFIGEDGYRYRGYGRVMIRAFLRGIVFAEPDVTACAIDPCLENTVAIAAYRKAGFRDVGIARNEHENCDSLILVIDREALLDDSDAQATT
jgi:aminoglycoside 6'-N-acetyltransferase